MKRIFFIFTTVVMVMALLNGCIVIQSDNYGGSSKNDRDAASKKAISASQKAETRTYTVNSFSKIVCNGVITVHFTQGEQTKVRAVCHKGKMEWLKINSDGDCLHLDTDDSHAPKKERKDGMDFEVYVSSPKLNALTISGVSNFKAMQVKSATFNMNVNGVSKLNIDNIISPDVKMSVDGVSEVRTSVDGKSLDAVIDGCSTVNLECNTEGVKIKNYGASTLNMTLTAGKASLENQGASIINTTAKVDHVDLYCAGSSKVNGQFRGTDMTVLNQGASHLVISFFGGLIDLTNQGASDANISLDCREFKATNSGASKLELIGTADKSKIDSDGASKLITKDFNKF